MRRALTSFVVLGALSASACASNPPSREPEDSGAGGFDARVAVDAGPGSDAGPNACPSGFHRCGEGCVADQPNEPHRGCRLACGDPCFEPPNGTATCTSDGRCDFTCAPPHRREGTSCTCTPVLCDTAGAMCGNPPDGCGGFLTCGACTGGTVCMTGRCGCESDTAEPNDSRTQARNIGAFSDYPDVSMTYNMFRSEAADATDWYVFTVADNYDVGLSNPDVRVILDQIPAGVNLDLALFYVCDYGGDYSTCTAGAPDMSIGSGCTSASTGVTSETVELHTSCDGSDEAGHAYVRVTTRAWTPICAPYRLTVDTY